MLVSIIVRSKNEERWITQCLRAVQKQTVKDCEVILVDNKSTDGTVARACAVYPALKVVTVDPFKPGHAINEGIRASSGKYLCCLSAHCVPVHETWLQALLRNIEEDGVAGVYGRQVPMSFSDSVDKRDLLLTFGLDRRVQVKDTFFHNANSLIPKEVWEHFPFDEAVSNIEDRVWGKQVIDAGYRIIYEPDASVYHYHGIHQGDRRDRADSVVRIMEGLGFGTIQGRGNFLDPAAVEIAAIIPLRGGLSDGVDSDATLIETTIQSAKASKYINRVIVSTDSTILAEKVRRMGADAPFIRPKGLSGPGVRADEVLKFSLEQLEVQGYYPDVVVPLEITYPFRPQGLLDGVIEQLLSQGLDTVIAGFAERRPCWLKEQREIVQLTEYTKHRNEREPLHVGLTSLACATYPEFVRQGKRLGAKLGIYEIHDPIAAIEVRDTKTLQLLERWRNIQFAQAEEK